MKPPLKILVAEAAQALSVLDVERLEHLANACEVLNRDLSPETQQACACEVRAAKKEMAALAKMLEVTRSNVTVMERIRVMHTSRLEYAVAPPPASNRPEDAHGLD